MAVEPVDPDRMIHRDRVNPIAPRQLSTPQRVVPITTGNPRAGRHGAGERRDSCHELLAAGRVAQLHRGQPEAAIHEVHVGIHEPGDDKRSAEVDRCVVAAGELTDIRRAADRRNPIAGDRDRLGLGLGRIPGPDASVYQNHGSGFHVPRSGFRFGSGSGSRSLLHPASRTRTWNVEPGNPEPIYLSPKEWR